MSELKRMILLFFALLVCFIGAFLVLPTTNGQIMMGALAVITLYSVFRKIQQLWKDR